MEVGFPGQHTTTTMTTVTTSTTTHQRNIWLDLSYIRTNTGILKVIQMVCNILGILCTMISLYGYTDSGGWYKTVSWIGFWFTGIMIALYIYHVVEKFWKIPWIKIEFIFCGIWAICYLIAALLSIGLASNSIAFAIACISGFVATGAYGYDAWLKFNALKTDEPAQGQHEVKQTSTVASPAY